ncbi:acyl-CoA desaturase [Aliikangiella marina]|uniref:Acyl-CoA desaturase n=1 Tax=Aliikangiella marina TaxID=1712262 RepID=A0A545T8N9_9GAMM|nr:acyl-CoA desaturase [Aliikangiella marina]TQV73590.1 acyl-CoA desaturase [Aliikangiella marina]
MKRLSKNFASIMAWFDTTAIGDQKGDAIDAKRIIPFILMHLAVLGVFWVGFSWFAFWVAVGLYVLRMFAITGFYHRYFSHKNFKTSRPLQFIFAFIGASSAQRGPLWWASHHRHHHARADQPDDPHSPRQRGFLWSHTLWFLSNKNFSTRSEKIKDFAQFKELVWLDRFDMLAPFILALFLFVLGAILEIYAPSLETTGGQLLVWGFFVSTVVLYHATYTINSLAHRFGSRRFETKDDSRNNPVLALITLGEGWHNNHHYYCGTVRQGFKWYEFDITFYILKVMSWFGLVWDLKPIPEKIYRQMEQAKT